MTEQKSQRSLTQIIKKNQISDLSSKINYLEEELKNKEILLINLEKLSSLGQFIKEITHELKNPLSAISGFTELGKIAKTKNDREEYLNKIPKFINQITSRLSQFRAMTFNTGIKYDKIDLIQILAECLSTVELLKPKSSSIESHFKSKNLHIFGDPEQWIQVFLGVCRSFFNYMTEIKSTLKVNADVLSSADLISKIDDIEIGLLALKDWKKVLNKNDNWIKIEFQNSKISVSKENISRALGFHQLDEQLDKFTELGIVIACDIVERHQGNIYTKKSRAAGFSLQICVPLFN
jgi:signal transduction histidine kinase